MKADPTDLTKLLDLQALDTAIEQVKRKARDLPAHQAIASLTDRRVAARDNLIAAQTVLSDVTAAAERAENDVTPVRDRLARNQARIDAGEMDAKALSSAIDEVGHLKQRISDLEDAQLEAMEAVERANSQVGEMTAAVAGIERELRQQISARDGDISELKTQAQALAQTRADQAGQIDPALLALYDKVRTRSSGIAVARFEGRRCLGCGLEATITDYNRYMAAPADEVVRCAECDRILIR